MRKLNFVPVLFILSVIISCEPEEEILAESSSPVQTEIDNELKVYFDRFESEGASRGFIINLEEEGITGVIEEISQEFVAGTCTYGTHLPGDVVIDLEFWNNSSAFAKEMVIFHELGHCFLRRDHKESSFSNGTCRSIMRSGTGDCLDNYNSQTRADYIDELFFFKIAFESVYRLKIKRGCLISINDKVNDLTNEMIQICENNDDLENQRSISLPLPYETVSNLFIQLNGQ